EGVFKCPEDQLPLDYAKGHQGTCPQESVYCENKCGARMMRRLLSQHALAECPKRTQPCTYCAKEFVFDTIQNHQYQCPRYPVPCPNQCGTPSIAREDVPTHLKESCSTAMLLCPFKDAGCKHRCPKLAMGRHLEESTKAHLGMVCALVSRQRQEILELRRDMEELSVSSDGTLIWKISDYTRKLQEAKARSNYEFFSPPFYTHKYGYKLQVSAFLNGNGSGESSHLSTSACCRASTTTCWSGPSPTASPSPCWTRATLHSPSPSTSPRPSTPIPTGKTSRSQGLREAPWMKAPWASATPSSSPMRTSRSATTCGTTPSSSKPRWRSLRRSWPEPRCPGGDRTGARGVPGGA
ncbi:TNF receptor-associated factor 4, partial [Columba livia]